MIGFFMAYIVDDSLTGVGLVDQMGIFFCKTLLFIAVVGVLLIRKNEDLENLKKLLDENLKKLLDAPSNSIGNLLCLSKNSMFLSISCYCSYSVLVKNVEFKFTSL
ncbi:hypothetical protein ACB092_07G104900 [Castanea dentata]